MFRETGLRGGVRLFAVVQRRIRYRNRKRGWRDKGIGMLRTRTDVKKGGAEWMDGRRKP